MNYYWFNLVEKIKIRKFHKFVYAFCKQNGLNDFNDFLNYNYNGFASDTYRFLFIAPNTYLVCSKSFFEFYSKLASDFRDDIMSYQEYNLILEMLKENQSLVKYINKLLGKDMVDYVYTTERHGENSQ